MEKKDVGDGFTNIVCSYCFQRLHKTETISWRGKFAYHSFHAKHHKPQVKVEHDAFARPFTRVIREKHIN